MKKSFLLILLLAWTGISLAQNNPYEIDDECYNYYSQADLLVGKPEFKDVNEQLLVTARQKGDTKAETLYYVEVLKDLIAHPVSPENDKAVDEAFETLKEVASKYGYAQYFYFSYQITQNYYHNSNRNYRALQLLKEMQELALKENSAYGLWGSVRYLASLYIAQNDYVSAKPYLLKAIKVYKETDDPTVKRQSPTRVYCDLADTYPIGSASVRVYLG